MREYDSLKDVRDDQGDLEGVEVLLDGEWWILRGTPKGMLWVSRRGRNAIHAIPWTRAERFRAGDVAAVPRSEPPPEVIALGPEDDGAAGEDPEAPADAAPAASRRRRGPRAGKPADQLKLFG